ncbi:Mitochondrial ribosome small subunit biogenesis protein [Didymella sp. IMI 355093]|nr:Mitochondrial ribosome small subunit biogenesis protein [Didymella sp. IMI 355093]
MRPALRQARTLLNHDALQAPIPIFLCPALLRPAAQSPRRHARPAPRFSTFGRAQQEASAPVPSTETIESEPPNVPPDNTQPEQRSLPRACPGCGAPSQLYDKKEAGFYNVDRGAVRAYLKWDPAKVQEATQEDDVYSKALKDADPELLKELRVLDAPTVTEALSPDTPVCDRCHNLIHHSVGTPIHHPTVDSIQATISESPHRRNHIYHVVDAADFPLSIVPNLQSSLRIPKLRTQNRRAKHKGWVANDRIAEVSFIITRADLLAPKKEQVDTLMPYITEVLRDALGRDNNKARLGNVRLVSAKRGWWTKQVKDDIWDRGGAGWMVGKVNVGKSNLFEAVFPKGRGADYQDVRKIRSAAEREAMMNAAQSLEDLTRVQKQLADEDAEIERYNNRPNVHVHQPPRAIERDPEEEEEEEDPDALLPPPQPYTPYPVLPIASSLPGTTASPIRIPFGNNRGELVDLPGLARTSPGLETFVQPAHQQDLIMTSRLNAERLSLKPGQSLILGGGLIRITPVTEDTIFLIHSFVPIHAHVTRTEKAAAYQTQTSDRQLQVPPILAPNVGDRMNSAGRFQLKWDATKKLAGPLTSTVAGKMKPENLPFRIWSLDVLLEGVGWVEVSAQTRRPQGWKPVGLRKKDPNHAKHERERRLREEKEYKDRKFGAIAQAELHGEDLDDALSREFARDKLSKLPGDEDGDQMADWQESYPEIEVFSPLGKFVGVRRPMCASTVMGPKQVSSRERIARPRRSMKSVKQQRKPAAKE